MAGTGAQSPGQSVAGIYVFLLVLLALTLGEAGWNTALSFMELGDPAGNRTLTGATHLSADQVGAFAVRAFTFWLSRLYWFCLTLRTHTHPGF